MGRNAKTVLIFGATGMFGRELVAESANRGYRTLGASRHGPDLAVDICHSAALQQSIHDAAPDLIINSAAIVSHAGCETDSGMAYRVNAGAVADMALAARQCGAKLVQISTDHYFAGDGDAKHAETAPVTLLNAYARSKYAGEAFALTNADALVIRTNVTGFRQYGTVVSFIEWVFNALEQDAEFNLFGDYFASTIATSQAAPAIFDLAALDARGIVNVACREVASKQAFVEAIARHAGADTRRGQVVSVNDHLAARADSVGLDVGLAERLLERCLPTLDEVARQLVGEHQALSDCRGGDV